MQNGVSMLQCSAILYIWDVTVKWRNCIFTIPQ